MRDSFIVSLMQPVSYSYFGKVANVKVKFRGRDNVLSFFAALSFHEPN